MSTCRFCSKNYDGSYCPDCGRQLYTAPASIVCGTTIDDASDCEITVTPKYLFIRRVSKSEKNKATAGRAFGLLGRIVAEAATEKSNEFGWYPLSDFSKAIYPYITKKSKLNPGIKLIAKDGRELLLIFDTPGDFDSSRKAAKTVAKHLGDIIPEIEDASQKDFGSKGCQNPYVTEENFDKIRPAQTATQAKPAQSAPKAAPKAAPVQQAQPKAAAPAENQQAPKTMRRPCPNCGYFVLEGSKFCNECGTKIQRERKCLRCGKILAENEKFCGECGYQAK